MPINREEVREFFNGLACKWDSYTPAEDWIVTKIFTNIGSIQNQTVLDVGCGTGFLVPYYIQGNVGDLDCIDIAEQMIDVARSKFDYANVNFICDDILEYEADEKYDLIMIFNAFPHIPATRETFMHLASLLKTEGILTIAHSMSRENLIRHHDGVSESVSVNLPETSVLEDLSGDNFKIIKTADDDDMVQIIFKKTSK